MAPTGQVILLTCLAVQFGLVVTASNSVIQCLAGQEKNTSLTFDCFNATTPYINVKNVLLGIVPIKSACDANSTYSTCCTETDACLRPNAALFNEMYAQCSGKSICKRGPSVTSAWMMDGCNMGKYNAYATYLKVEYECLADDPLTTTPTAKPTTTLPTSTATYSNNLTMGEQAAIICCIMLFIFIIAAAVVIYKRIKYGPPEDFRKLFSKPHVEGAESPGVTPWIAGEAQEQVYNVIAEKQKKKKKKFPKFKF